MAGVETVRWKTLDDELVFEVGFPTQTSLDERTSVTVECVACPGDRVIVCLAPGETEHLDKDFRCGPYVRGTLRENAHRETEDQYRLGVYAEIAFGHIDQHDEQHFEGYIALVNRQGPEPPHPPGPPEPPQPPMPPSPPARPTPNRTPVWPGVSETGEDLFPYLYMRYWPRLSQWQRELAFVAYRETASPPAGGFYHDLCRARARGRDAMLELALAFVQGDPPYQGLMVWNPGHALGMGGCATIIPHIPTLQTLPADKAFNVAATLEAVLASLSLNDARALFATLQSAGCRQWIDRVWQSYFALVMINGYDTADRFELNRTLVTWHWLSWLASPDKRGTLDSTMFRTLVNASIALPAAVFPLPPADSGSPPGGAGTLERGWVEPYAVGDLQLVRQRLLGYEPGEVAHIENVMAGERKEVVSRELERQMDYDTSGTGREEVREDYVDDARQDLSDAIRKTVTEACREQSYDRLKTTYGPPAQSTLDGSATLSVRQGGEPGTEDSTRFARTLTDRTVNRIHRQVQQARGQSRLSGREESVTRVIDNSSRDGARNNVFRWVNRRYEARVINYGNRLLVEFMLENPAAGYIHQQSLTEGEDFRRPASPASRGILSFRHITRDNYAALASSYEVLDLQAPPAAGKSASLNARAGDEKQLPLPEGYIACRATVTFLPDETAAAGALVIVGRERFSPTRKVPEGERRFGQDGSIPVSVQGAAEVGSPPSSDRLWVNVDVECECGDRLFDDWRIGLYQSIQQGYQRQMERYQAAAGRRHRSKRSHRVTERSQLRRGCERLLLSRAMELTGALAPVPERRDPPQAVVNLPRYQGFLGGAFEWSEMSYRFYQNPLSDSGGSGDLNDSEDPEFAGFLTASHARVLVPVVPERTLAVVYFLSSGAIWDGPDALVPVNPGDLSLVNELKQLPLDRREAQSPVGEPWELVVPTTMQWLDSESLFEGQCFDKEDARHE